MEEDQEAAGGEFATTWERLLWLQSPVQGKEVHRSSSDYARGAS
jgi:hypothetical protein